MARHRARPTAWLVRLETGRAEARDIEEERKQLGGIVLWGVERESSMHARTGDLFDGLKQQMWHQHAPCDGLLGRKGNIHTICIVELETAKLARNIIVTRASAQVVPGWRAVEEALYACVEVARVASIAEPRVRRCTRERIPWSDHPLQGWLWRVAMHVSTRCEGIVRLRGVSFHTEHNFMYGHTIADARHVLGAQPLVPRHGRLDLDRNDACTAEPDCFEQNPRTTGLGARHHAPAENAKPHRKCFLSLAKACWRTDCVSGDGTSSTACAGGWWMAAGSAFLATSSTMHFQPGGVAKACTRRSHL